MDVSATSSRSTPASSTVQEDDAEAEQPSSNGKSDDISHLSEGSARSTRESSTIRSVMDDFLKKPFDLTGSPTKEELEVKSEEAKRKTIEATNDGLKLQLALKAMEASEKMSSAMARIGPAMDKVCSRLEQFMDRGEKRRRERDEDEDERGAEWVLRGMGYDR